MRPTSVTIDPPDPPAVRGAGQIVIAGEAVVLELKFQPRSGASDDDWQSRLNAAPTRAELERAARKAVRRGFGRSYNVSVGAATTDGVVVARVTGYERSERSSLFGSRPGVAFEAKVLQTLRTLAREAEEIAVAAGLPLAATASWTPGEGLTLAREDARSAGTADIEGRISEARGKQRTTRRMALVAGAMGTVLTAVGLIIAAKSSDPFAAFVFLPYGIGALIIGALLWTMVRESEHELRDLRDQLDLSELMQEPLERRAQKLFQVHSHQLRRYYDQALRHRAMIFGTGLLCIAAGFGVIVAAFVLMDKPNLDLSEKIVIASLGAIGGILGNFIAIVYLKMFSETIKSIGGFHDRLVVTHHLHFANFLAAKVSDRDARDKTFARMAQALATLHVEDPDPGVVGAVDGASSNGQ